jgi:hypothetical protein
MPLVRFEPPFPLFELAKTVHAFDRAATVIGTFFILVCKLSHSHPVPYDK